MLLTSHWVIRSQSTTASFDNVLCFVEFARLRHCRAHWGRNVLCPIILSFIRGSYFPSILYLPLTCLFAFPVSSNPFPPMYFLMSSRSLWSAVSYRGWVCNEARPLQDLNLMYYKHTRTHLATSSGLPSRTIARTVSSIYSVFSFVSFSLLFFAVC